MKMLILLDSASKAMGPGTGFVMIHFVSSSMPEEHLIGLLDCQRITSEILTHLSDADHTADNTVSSVLLGLL